MVDLFDSYSFRFLLQMYILLGEEDQSLAERSLCNYLRERIYKVCSGHLEWSFNVAESRDGRWSMTNRVSGKQEFADLSDWSSGAAHVLKLHEYLEVFPNERPSILRYIAARFGPWLSSLEAQRDEKSKLWPSAERSVQVHWQNIEYRSDESVKLPKYYLGDHIDLWKILSSTQRILEEDLDLEQDSQDQMSIDDALEKVKSVSKELKSTFAPGPLRDLIMKRFTHTQSSSSESKSGANTLILSSRCALSYDPRIQFYYHSDTTLEDFSNGFFDDANGKPSQAWAQTLASQNFKTTEKAWKTSANLSLRVLLARYGPSLNETYRKTLKSEDPVKQILKLAVSNGMILDGVESDASNLQYVRSSDPYFHSRVVWVLMSTSDWKPQQNQKPR
jgi:hypothetical protein